MAFARLPVMRSGQIGTVTALDGATAFSKRLADLGFVRGARIEMIRAGSPCIVRIENTRVGLGADHQDAIELMLP